MNHKGTKQLETGRLILRPFRMADADAMYRNWASDPGVTRYLTWNAHTSAEDSKQVLASWTESYSNPAYYQWAIVLKALGEPVGSISAVRINERTEDATIGYCIGRKWWGQGITAEALGAVITFFFEEVGTRCINACHDPRNPNSGKVMRKCGMKTEGTRRQAGFNNQGICDEVWHSILRHEYFEKKGLRIETERLLIRTFTPEMAEDVHINSLDEDNRRFVPDEVFETVEDAQETVDFLIGQYGGTEGPFVYPVILKENLANIGYVQLVPIDEGWEIGYHIAKAYTGKGYASEAASAFLPEMAKLHRLDAVYGICLAENKASVRVMEKCGFERLYAGPGPYQGAEREIVRNIWRNPESVQNREKDCGRLPDIRRLKLQDLQPSQFYISEKKLADVRKWFDPEDLSRFDAIPVKILDGLPVMTDGHTRAVAAILAGLERVPLVWDEDDLDLDMYRRCVEECAKLHVLSPQDLVPRILSEADYAVKWDRWCDAMQADVREKRAQE